MCGRATMPQNSTIRLDSCMATNKYDRQQQAGDEKLVVEPS